MAGDWIKMRMDLGDDPAVVFIAERTGLDEDAVVGKLHRLWCWADKHTTDGTAPAITERWVDRYVAKAGFADAMVNAGWLTFSESGVEFPNFERHNGKSAKVRSENTIRQRLSRKNRDEHESGEIRTAIPKPFYRHILRRDGYTCVYCGTQSDESREQSRKAILGIDHITPESRGGIAAIENLACCCRKCNNEKNDRTPEEWGILPDFLQPGVTYKNGKMSQIKCDENKTREEKRREELKPSVLASSVPSSPTSTTAGRVCARLKQAGVSAVNPSNPKLLALLDAGLGEDELADIAGEPGAKGKGFAWILAAAEGRRREAATIGNLPNARASPYRTRMDQQAETLAGLTGGLVSPKPKESNNDRSIEPEYRALPSAAVG